MPSTQKRNPGTPSNVILLTPPVLAMAAGMLSTASPARLRYLNSSRGPSADFPHRRGARARAAFAVGAAPVVDAAPDVDADPAAGAARSTNRTPPLCFESS